jgi:16S rRNA (uracil1498-N3)-methyltransferase
VLRANIGDQGILFDGFGGEYKVELKAISKKNATATLLTHLKDDRTAPIISKIGLVMSRGERMDYAVQKATELGVTAIQLLSSHHGEVNLKPAQIEKKLAHWQQVAIAACEQCGLNRPPLILAPLSINEWLNQPASDALNTATLVSPIVSILSQDTYYQVLRSAANLRMQMSVPAAGQPAKPEKLASVLKQESPYIELLIGPEGGLSDDECQKAESVGFMPWQIGSRVLRTETAPVVALTTLLALYG